MSYNTLISATALQQNINNPKWVIIDCRFSRHRLLDSLGFTIFIDKVG